MPEHLTVKPESHSSQITAESPDAMGASVTRAYRGFFAMFQKEPEMPELDIGDGLAFVEQRFNKNAWQMFEYVRAEIKEEHTLLTGRVSWFITSQSFLITAYSISYGNAHGPNWFSNLILPLLGVSVSWPAFYMIQGATRTIGMWRELQQKIIQKNPQLDPVLIPRWQSNFSDRSDTIHLSAMWFPKFLPWLFGLIWVAVAYFSWHTPWVKR